MTPMTTEASIINRMVQAFLNRGKNLLVGEHKSILSAALVIGGSFLASAMLGLVRNHLLAARFFGGFEADLDVYFAAFVIPDTIFQLLIVGAISAAFIPIFQESYKKSQDDAYQMANASLTSLGLILFFFTTLIVIFARPLSGLIAHYSDKQLDLMANLIRIMSLAQLIFTFSAFLTGILQAQRRFLLPAIAPLLYNVGTITGILLFANSIGIYSAAVGVVFGALLHMLVQLPLTKHLGFTPRILFMPNHPAVKNMLKLMPPRTLSLGLDQIERWVAVNLTSLLAAGSLSVFNFARQLYVLPISLFGISLSQASFPALAEEAAKNDYDSFRKTLAKTILQIFFFAFPASVIILILRIPLVRLAFGARSFPWDATLLTAKVLSIMALSIAPQAVAHLLTRAFHALKNTKIPLLVGFISMVAFTLFSVLVSSYYGWGLVGIALGISLASFLDFFLLYYLLISKVGRLDISWKIIKMSLVSLASGIALYIPMKLLDQFVLDTTKTIWLIVLTLVVSLVGFFVYCFFSYLLKIEELEDVFSIIRRLGNWRKVLGESDEVIESNPPA